MRASQFLVTTLKEVPAEAEVISHRLMLRAGLIRRLAAGVYTWLPTGYRVQRKVEAIVREEMNRAGAVEMIMPVVQPAEMWQESGRWSAYGPELLRFKDRHDRDFVIQPTSEEVITDLARAELKSYRKLPLHLYQIQTKFRDERRPRFGIMRGREFVMKDGYSFHASYEDLQREYRNMYDTYTRIFTRLGLKFRAVAADTGSIGGTGSHEFHVLADSGEDAIAWSPESQYAANVELAQALDEPSFVHNADLVQHDLAFLALKREWDAGRVVAALSGHGRNDHGTNVVVHFIGRDDDARAGFADFVALDGVEADEVDVETRDYQRHSFRSHCVAEAVSSSRSLSSRCSDISENASDQPARGT